MDMDKSGGKAGEDERGADVSDRRFERSDRRPSRDFAQITRKIKWVAIDFKVFRFVARVPRSGFSLSPAGWIYRRNGWKGVLRILR
jgi:hypothetical protein